MSRSRRDAEQFATGGWLHAGLRGGVALGVVVVIFAVLGLTPSLSWIPEAPLVALAVLVPIAGLAAVGYRVTSHTGRFRDAPQAAAIAGGISGVVGGVAYVMFGKPALNIGAGLVLGLLAGAVLGAVGGLVRRRTVRV